MKKLFAVILLCLLAAFAVACEKQDIPEECKHKRLTETLYAPDCSLEGYTQHVCLDCGHTYKSDFVEPAGHKITTAITAPTCTEEGFTTYTCSVCNYSYKAGYIEPAGHTLTSKITPQTCTAEGYTTYSCPCGYSFRTAQVIPNGHNLTKTTVAPTCNADGYDLYSCNLCDYQYKTEFTSMIHTFTETKADPTCVAEGYTLVECKNCEYTYKTNYVAPTGHTFTEKTVAPTFNTTGYTIFTCKCGFSYIGDYVWYSNVFSGVSGNENKVLARGVDLSYHNGVVDFQALAKANIDFVILRVGYLKNGRANEDEKFEEYYAAARNAGLDIGAYIYSYDTNTDDLITNTAAMLKSLAGKKFEYPIYLDIEDDSQKTLSKETLMDMCVSYCELLVENKYFPGIYSYLNFITTKLDAEKLAATFEVWMAHYYIASENYYADKYNMWQYTETATVAGINGKVDLNVCYKDYPTIIETHGYNGYGK